MHAPNRAIILFNIYAPAVGRHPAYPVRWNADEIRAGRATFLVVHFLVKG
jgi:hypothetical protein